MSSSARSPRGLVHVNGQPVTGWIDLEVDNNTYQQADSFTVTFALSKLQNIGQLTGSDTLSVELFAGTPPNPENYSTADLTSWIYGNVDEVHFDPVQRTLELSGRDLTSLLIDAKTTEKFPNKTASQIAELFASRHGLTPMVTATSTQIGRYYQIDHVRMTSASTEWELLTWLAEVEQFQVYVTGKELHFEPKTDNGVGGKFKINWQEPTADNGVFSAPLKQISFDRTLTVGKGVVVEVRSWNQKQKKGFTATYPTNKAKGIKPGKSAAPAQVYSYVIANLTQEQAIQRAKALYNDIIKHEMRMNAMMPADDALTARCSITVIGTNTPFDQDYFPESVIRRLDCEGGYTMQVRAKNHSSDTSLIP